MLTPILRTTDGKPCPLDPDAILAAIEQAADNTARVMPPLAAKHLRGDLLQVSGIVRDFLAEDLDNARFLLVLWSERIDEINAYAARTHQHVEHELFLRGTTPDDAAYVAPAETLADALNEIPAAGVAHRMVTRTYGPWVVDRPAAAAIKETAA